MQQDPSTLPSTTYPPNLPCSIKDLHSCYTKYRYQVLSLFEKRHQAQRQQQSSHPELYQDLAFEKPIPHHTDKMTKATATLSGKVIAEAESWEVVDGNIYVSYFVYLEEVKR